MNKSTEYFETKSKIDIEQLLKDGHAIKVKPQGYSMYPMFIPGRDEAVIEHVPLHTLHRGDVVLYRRDHSILVLHRICKIKKDGFYMVGDNQSEVEGPLRPDQIKGRLTEFVRNGRTVSVTNPVYLLYTSLWLFLRPFRPCISKIYHVLSSFVHAIRP